MRLLGIIMTYNDGDCIHNSIECLLNSGHDVHVFDHGSTDMTHKVLEKYPINVIPVSRQEYPNFTVPGTNNIHHRVTTYILSKRHEFDWVTWIDADEIILSHDKSNIKNDIKKANTDGYQGLKSNLREYWCTETDDETEADYLKRIRNYVELGCDYGGGVNRCWNIDITPTMTEATLRHTFFQGKHISPVKTILKHYPIRDIDQGYNKINHNRQIYGGAGNHYASLRGSRSLKRSGNWGTKDVE